MNTQTEYERKRMGELMAAAHDMAQKKHDDPAQQLMHELMHAAIAIAGDQGRERSTIARAMGIAKDTLDTRLGSKPDKPLRSLDLARLMFDPSVLGTKAHAWLVEQFALRVGRVVLMPVSVEQPGSVEREMLEVGDATGFLSAVALDVTDPMGEGGVFVTSGERRKLSAAAGGVMAECTDLIDLEGALQTAGVLL